jgi:UDP-N-acetylmuramoyl-tripeptide--D-alanyl-D-alanine ligase
MLQGEELGYVSLGEARYSIALGNVACALAAAIAIGVEPASALVALSSLPVAENRLTVLVGSSGASILDDTYNSNPDGAALALEALRALAKPDHRVVVVSPGMVELGPVQFFENAEFAIEAADVATDFIIVGRTNRKALLTGVRDAALDGARCEVRLVAIREEAVAIIRDEMEEGDAVLFENDLPDHYA